MITTRTGAWAGPAKKNKVEQRRSDHIAKREHHNATEEESDKK